MTTITATRLSDATNPAVELARYRLTGGERVIYGQRVLGVVRLTDVPADRRGRHYLIERGLSRMAELHAIVADYLTEAQRWDAAPAEIRWLDHPDADTDHQPAPARARP
jgi:hypothetical protein